MSFLLSVLIPTRNRYMYAEAAVRQILNIRDERIQIIVQDNSDIHELEERLRDVLDNKRVDYRFVEQRLSGVDNFNQAAQRAQGEYIVAIGDDDGISPQIMQCVEWMKKENVHVVKPSIGLGFSWPHEDDEKTGYVSVSRATGKRRMLNTKRGVIEMLKNGGQEYFNKDMAKSYHGIVKKECMDRVFKKTGAYYNGLSPDIYSAVSLSLLDDINVMEIDYPFTISGVCSQSTSAASSNNKHVGKLEDAPHFIGTHDYKWEEEVPAMYSVQTIWAETAVKAVKMNGHTDDVKKYFNKKILWNKCIANNYQYRELILEDENWYQGVHAYYVYKLERAHIFWRRVKGFIRRKLGVDKIVFNVETIDDAVIAMGKELDTPLYRKALEKALMPISSGDKK